MTERVPGVDFHWADGYKHEGPMADCRDRSCRVFALTGLDLPESALIPGWTDSAPERQCLEEGDAR